MSAGDLDRRLSTFFTAASSEALPDGLLDDVYRVTRPMPQRKWPAVRRTAALAAWWSSPFGIAPRLRVLAVVALLVIALLAALTYVAGHWRRVPPPFGPAGNGLIVFDVDQQLYVADPEGSAVPLAIGLGHSWNAAFSPDGLQLAFWSQADPRTPVRLFVADADGSRARSITGEMAVVADKLAPIAWSPDSRRIAFSSSLNGKPSRLYVAAADGSGVAPISPDDGGDRTGPAWSPGGDLIAFRLIGGGGGAAGLAVVAPDGSGEHVLQHEDVFFPPAFASPLWSPDGTRIANQWYPDGVERVGFVGLDGVAVVIPEEDGAEAPVWSNDGRRLAYDLTSSGSVVVRDLATGDRKVLPPGLGDCAVFWSPDDSALLGIGGCRTPVRIPLDNPGAATPLSSVTGDLHMFSWQRVAP